MIDPYVFVRSVTLSLAVLWTVLGLLRAVRFVARWERRFAEMGLSRRWLRRQVVITLVRATVLDPINLALMIFLLGIWSFRSVL